MSYQWKMIQRLTLRWINRRAREHWKNETAWFDDRVNRYPEEVAEAVHELHREIAERGIKAAGNLETQMRYAADRHAVREPYEIEQRRERDTARQRERARLPRRRPPKRKPITEWIFEYLKDHKTGQSRTAKSVAAALRDAREDGIEADGNYVIALDENGAQLQRVHINSLAVLISRIKKTLNS